MRRRSQAHGLVLRGGERLRRVRADGLHPATGDDAKAAPSGLLKKCILRVRKGGAEHHRLRRTGSDTTVAERGGSIFGELLVLEQRFRRKDAVVEPFEKLAPAVRVAREGLRKMHVGVHEPG